MLTILRMEGLDVEILLAILQMGRLDIKIWPTILQMGGLVTKKTVDHFADGRT